MQHNEPVRVQRRASATGVIMIAGQKIALGRTHAGQTVTILASGTTLTVHLGEEETRIVPRTTTRPVRSIKSQRPRAAAPADQQAVPARQRQGATASGNPLSTHRGRSRI